MSLAKVIRSRIRRNVAGVDFDADVNAAVAANVGEHGQTTSVSSSSATSAGPTDRSPREEREDPS